MWELLLVPWIRAQHAAWLHTSWELGTATRKMCPSDFMPFTVASGESKKTLCSRGGMFWEGEELCLHLIMYFTMANTLVLECFVAIKSVTFIVNVYLLWMSFFAKKSWNNKNMKNVYFFSIVTFSRLTSWSSWSTVHTFSHTIRKIHAVSRHTLRTHTQLVHSTPLLRDQHRWTR